MPSLGHTLVVHRMLSVGDAGGYAICHVIELQQKSVDHRRRMANVVALCLTFRITPVVMSSISRAHLSRVRRSVETWRALTPVRSAVASSSPRLPLASASTLRRLPVIGARTLVLARPSLNLGRRAASTAAALKETDADAEDASEQQWPERVLPELKRDDIRRLSRQRNIGM